MSTTLYHATSTTKAALIETQGMLPGSYWGTEEIADYYAETVVDEGEDYVIISISLDTLRDLDAAQIVPDHAGIEEPLTYTLGMSEDDVAEAWDESAQDWEASLEIIQSLRFTGPIPADQLTFEYPEGCRM